MQKKLSEIAELLGTAFDGEDILVSGISGADNAAEDYITFMESEKYLKAVKNSKAKAVIIPVASKDIEGKTVIRVKNPRLAFSQVLNMFHKPRKLASRIHPTAVIGENCDIAADVSIGAYAVIGNNVKIGAESEIWDLSYIAEGVTIGKNTVIRPRCVVMFDCIIGDNVLLHPGCVIGADGFGFVRDGAKQIKIPQIGKVRVGNDVEIGANTTIDRATTGETVISNGTKIDNLVQIGHNTVLGEDCTVVSQSGVAGSTVIGDRVVIAAQAGIRDHVEVGSDCIIGGRSGVTKGIKSGSVVSGFPAKDHREELKLNALFMRLPDIISKIDEITGKGKQ